MGCGLGFDVQCLMRQASDDGPSFMYRALVHVLQLVQLCCRDLAVEVVILCPEVAVLRRQAVALRRQSAHGDRPDESVASGGGGS